MNSDSEYDALDLLLIDLFEVGLDPARMGQLNALLAADPAARARFIDRSTINALLEWQAGRVDFSMRHTLPSLSRNNLNQAMVMPAIMDSVEQEQEEIEPAEPMELPTRRLPDRQAGSARRRLRIPPFAAAILVLVSIGAVMLMHWRQWSRAQPRMVGMLTGSDDVRWEPGFAPQSGSAAIAQGEQLSLLSGSVRIDFDGGASVIIQAPAQFFANSTGTMTLTSGSICAAVPQRARGFTISTPDVVVKDLGTEFGINCAQNVPTEVDVFKGTVEATVRSDHPSPTRLVAGEAATVSAGALVPIPDGADKQEFPQLSELAGVPSGIVTHPASLPPGFSDTDIANVGIAGSAKYAAADGVWTVSGSGEDIYHTKDHFNFASRQVQGDGTIICRLTTPTTQFSGHRERFAKCGIMFRAGAAPGSPFVDLVFTEWLGLQMISRDTPRATAFIIGPHHTPIDVPVWLKLTRAGDSFTGSYSVDGSKWATIGTHTASMPPNALVGLAVSSGDEEKIGAATFADVSVQSGAPTR